MVFFFCHFAVKYILYKFLLSLLIVATNEPYFFLSNLVAYDPAFLCFYFLIINYIAYFYKLFERELIFW